MRQGTEAFPGETTRPPEPSGEGEEAPLLKRETTEAILPVLLKRLKRVRVASFTSSTYRRPGTGEEYGRMDRLRRHINAEPKHHTCLGGSCILYNKYACQLIVHAEIQIVIVHAENQIARMAWVGNFC